MDFIFSGTYTLTISGTIKILFKDTAMIRLIRNVGLPLLLAALNAGCDTEPPNRQQISLVDPDATEETVALYINLKSLSRDHILFGHQDDLAYGVQWINEPGRSDVKEVAGSYPAVYGWELGDLELGAEQNLDKVNFANMLEWIKEGYSRGGVVTISWHMNNPVSGGNAWETTPAVPQILPGGTHHEMFRKWLDTFADFISRLTVPRTDWSEYLHSVPVIFRPYHEHNGSWFWWGADHCTPDEYKELWRFTVRYLRDEKGLHNLLYAYSPDRFDTEQKYLERYPGDEYIDILGYDDYGNVRSGATRGILADRLRMLVQLAEERGKVPALTETGYEAIPDSTWWTDVLLAGINFDSVTRRIAYVHVWRNANLDTDRQNHFYAPYPGHASSENFIQFRNDPLILFEDDLPVMYKLP
jgi:mannan endo-1,4-beta-mannosidase